MLSRLKKKTQCLSSTKLLFSKFWETYEQVHFTLNDATLCPYNYDHETTGL